MATYLVKCELASWLSLLASLLTPPDPGLVSPDVSLSLGLEPDRREVDYLSIGGAIASAWNPRHRHTCGISRNRYRSMQARRGVWLRCKRESWLEKNDLVLTNPSKITYLNNSS